MRARILGAARDLRLLPREALVRTNPLDQADWNFRPGLGWVQRLRLRAVAAAVRGRRGRLLEVGYGSGVFLPELARHCDALHAADVHRAGAPVARVLAALGVDAALVTAPAAALPYPDRTFDTVVTVSTLEFVPDVGAAVRELLRVTRPGGRLVVVTPGESRVLDAGLRLLTGERAEDTFEGRRGLVVPAVEAAGRVVAVRPLPPRAGRLLPVYRLVVATPRAAVGA